MREPLQQRTQAAPAVGPRTNSSPRQSAIRSTLAVGGTSGCWRFTLRRGRCKPLRNKALALRASRFARVGLFDISLSFSKSRVQRVERSCARVSAMRFGCACEQQIRSPGVRQRMSMGMKINGKTLTVKADADTPVVVGDSRRDGPRRHQIWLCRGPVRCLHGAPRQRADSFVRHAAVSGKVCRCCTYGRITAAVKTAASEMRMGKAA